MNYMSVEKVRKAYKEGYSSSEILDVYAEENKLIDKVTKARQEKFSDEEILQFLLEEEPEERSNISRAAEFVIQRPLEIAGAPFQALDVAYWAGKKAEKEGKNSFSLDTLNAMLDEARKAFNAPFRPIDERYPDLARPSTVVGVEGIGGTAADIVMQPSNVFVLPAIKRALARKVGPGFVSKISGQEIGKMPNITSKELAEWDKTITAEKGKSGPVIYGSGSITNVPMVLEPSKQKISQEVSKNLPIAFEPIKPLATGPEIPALKNLGQSVKLKQEGLFPLGMLERESGKKLKVVAGLEDTKRVFTVIDDKENIFGKIKLSEFPNEKRLHVDYVSASKQPIKDLYYAERGFLETEIPESFKSIHSNIEHWAEKAGYKIITIDPIDMEKAKSAGFRTSPETYPWSMWKRVGQKESFSKIETNPLHYELNEYSTTKNLFFDKPDKNTFAFYDTQGFEIFRTKKPTEAKSFIRNYPTPRVTDYRASKLYNDAIDNIKVNARKQELISEGEKLRRQEAVKKYGREAIGTKNIETYAPPAEKIPGGINEVLEQFGKEQVRQVKLSYQKMLNAHITDDVQKIQAETNFVKGEDLSKSRILNPVPGETEYSIGNIIKQKKEGSVVIKEGEELALKNIGIRQKSLVEEIVTFKGGIEPRYQTFNAYGEEAKGLFKRPADVAHKNQVIETKNLHRNFLEKFKDIENKSWDRIKNYMQSRDPIGMKTLEYMKTKNPKLSIPTLDQLSTREKETVAWLDKTYADLGKRFNDARILAGLKPVSLKENYHPFFRDLQTLSELGYHSHYQRLDEKLQAFVHKLAPFSSHAMERKKATIPFADINAKDAFLLYSDNALKHIHRTPVIGKSRFLLNSSLSNGFQIKTANPQFYSFATKYLDDFAGQKVSSELSDWVNRGLMKLNRNMTFSLLSYSLRSAIIQPTSLVMSASELGFKHLVSGLGDYFNGIKTGHPEVMSKSNILEQRAFEQAYDVLRNATFGSKAGQIQKKIGEPGLKMLQALDLESAKITWMAAYKKAKGTMKLAEDKAINFADDVVLKTQASGNIQDVAPISRTALGRTVTLFQTFAIGNWNFLMRDVLGIGNKQVGHKESFAKLLRYIVGANAVNFLYEDVLETYSPFPTPLKQFDRYIDEGKDWDEALMRSSAEVLEIVPIIGGGIKYGSHPMGPLAEYSGGITRKLTGKPELKSLPDLALTMAGIPGVSQAKKMFKGYMSDLTPEQILLGKIGTYEKEKPEKRR